MRELSRSFRFIECAIEELVMNASLEASMEHLKEDINKEDTSENITTYCGIRIGEYLTIIAVFSCANRYVVNCATILSCVFNLVNIECKRKCRKTHKKYKHIPFWDRIIDNYELP